MLDLINDFGFLIYPYLIALFFCLFAQWGFQLKQRKVWSISLMVILNANVAVFLGYFLCFVFSIISPSEKEPGSLDGVLEVLLFIIPAYLFSFFTLISLAVFKAVKMKKKKDNFSPL